MKNILKSGFNDIKKNPTIKTKGSWIFLFF